MRNSVTKSLLGDREVSVQLAIRYVVWSLSRYSLADNRVPHQYLMNAWSNQELLISNRLAFSVQLQLFKNANVKHVLEE